VAISGRKAVWKQEFFWIVAFRLTLRIRLFHIADDGLPAAVQCIYYRPRALRAGESELRRVAGSI
jgi:hypothetical protein